MSTLSNSIYGGAFDLANGNQFDEKKISNFLKFSALFYDNIIIVDSWFTTPNPLTTRLKEIISKKGQSAYEDTLTQALKFGFIKPALRLGESMLDTWENDKYGIGVGRFAGFDKEEGSKILAYVEYLLPKTNRYVLWPKEMGVGSNTDFSKLIYNYLVSDNSNLTFNQSLFENIPFNTIHKPDIKIFDKAELLRLNFIDMVNTNLDNSKFRRGDIEDLVKQHFNAESNRNIYDYINAQRNVDINYSLAYYLLNSVSTVYEIYHSKQFSTIGGLMPLHNDALIDEGIYNEFINTDLSETENLDVLKNSLIVEGKLDLSKIDFQSIIDFKEKEHKLYDEYRNRISELKNAQNITEFNSLKNDFLRFLSKKYLKKFFNINESSGIVGDITEIAGYAAPSAVGSALITSSILPKVFSIQVSELPLISLITAFSTFITKKKEIKNLYQTIKHTIEIRRFIKNNYALNFNLNRQSKI